MTPGSSWVLPKTIVTRRLVLTGGWALREQIEVGRNRFTAGEGCFEVFSPSKRENLSLRRLR